MTSARDYELIYHAGIPGRGEFVRLVFEATDTPYVDTARSHPDSLKSYMNGTFEGRDTNTSPFAPPILKHGQLVISQTSNILLYLATHLKNPIDLSRTHPETSSASPLTTLSPSSTPLEKVATPGTILAGASLYHVNEVVLTILDLNNEVHDSHHPIAVGDYYENQRTSAIERAKDFRKNRVPKFFRYFENLLERGGKRREWLVSDDATCADLCLFQVIDGLKFAFPNLLSRQLPSYPALTSHYDRVKSADRIKRYLESDRRQNYSMGIFRYYAELDEPEE